MKKQNESSDNENKLEIDSQSSKGKKEKMSSSKEINTSQHNHSHKKEDLKDETESYHLKSKDGNQPLGKPSDKKRVFQNNPQKTVKKDADINIPKGLLLEYRIKRLLFFMGYFAKIGIELKTSQEEDAVIITDLDVIGYYLHKDFSTKTIWVDCKSGSARTHERIAWIKGIMENASIDDALFVKSGIRTEIKHYAKKLSIRVLDMNILDKLEADYNIKNDLWEGSFNPESQYNQLQNLKRFAIPSNHIYKKIAKFISIDYWTLDDYSRIKKIITALRELSPLLEAPLNIEQTRAINWAVNELVSLFSMTVLNICRELNYFSDTEKRNTIVDGLSAGDVSSKKRKEIFDAAFRVAYGIVQNQVPDFNPPATIPPINLSPPNYTDVFCGLIDRVTKNPLHYYDVTRFLDFTLMEYDFQSKEINQERLKEIFKDYENILLGAKTLLHFILQVTNIPKSYFKIINL